MTTISAIGRGAPRPAARGCPCVGTPRSAQKMVRAQVPVSAQPPRPRRSRHEDQSRQGEGHPLEAPVGDVHRQCLGRREVLSDPNGKVTINSVFFLSPVAGPYWHRHSEGQVLYVTQRPRPRPLPRRQRRHHRGRRRDSHRARRGTLARSRARQLPAASSRSRRSGGCDWADGSQAKRILHQAVRVIAGHASGPDPQS